MGKRGRLDNLKPFEKGNKAAEKPFNKREFEALCRIQCTEQEIMDVMGFKCHKTLNAKCQEMYGCNFEEIYPSLKSNGKMSLRRMQWKSAKSGNVTMQIWLGKQELGQKDKQETTIDAPKSLNFILVDNNTDDRIDD